MFELQTTIDKTRMMYTPMMGDSVVKNDITSPMLETHMRTVAYEKIGGAGIVNDSARIPDNVPGEFISSRTVTSGNRTVETITVWIIWKYAHLFVFF